MPSSTERSSKPVWRPASWDLIGRIQEAALDPGYQAAADRGRGRRDPLYSRLLAAGVLAVFALLLATAGLQAHRNAPTQASDRRTLVDRIAAQKAELARLTNRAASLNSAVEALTTEGLTSTQAGRGVDAQLKLFGMAAGSYSVTGPGVRVTVDDAPGSNIAGGRVLDRDLQALVNGLWEAGAEAVAINNQRVTSLTAIRMAGSAITVNFHSLSRPYVVTAIGNPETLASKFTKSRGGQTWLSLQNVYGLRFQIASAQSVDLPGVATPVLRYARPLEVTP